MRISAGDPPCYIPFIRWVSPPIYPGIYTPLCIVLLSAIRSSYDLHLPPTMMRLLPCLSYPDCFICPPSFRSVPMDYFLRFFAGAFLPAFLVGFFFALGSMITQFLLCDAGTIGTIFPSRNLCGTPPIIITVLCETCN